MIKKRNILTILVLLAFSALLFAYPVYVHVAEDLPHDEEGLVSARHHNNPWQSQDYDDPGSFYFPNLTLNNHYTTDDAMVVTENYSDSGSAPFNPYGTHIYLHINKSEIPDPGEPPYE
ncbi:MAG: hypothetical protein HQ534_01845 [Armatimonadetes bacterium]|nr:hypothetical protein [Armatimonadota bacterium]